MARNVEIKARVRDVAALMAGPRLSDFHIVPTAAPDALRDGQSAGHDAQIARALMSSLGIAEADLLDVAYVDLLAATQR
ncbi:hypothetical protein LMG10661_00771 [Ralstonia syzygii subsp. syzygii]|nr:hypothetical protein LMG10661_00771 [Ralstonia syzygii subsp. syzygii]